MLVRRLLSAYPTCSVLLVAHLGAMAAPASGRRTKEEAQKPAHFAAGADFETLALKISGDPTVKTNHGKLGKIGLNQMNKAFTDNAFALLKFETGPVPLDTPAGLEIIRRME